MIAAGIASLVTGPLAIIGAIFGGVAAISELWQAIASPKGYKDLYQARDFYFTLTLIFTGWAFLRAWILKRRSNAVDGGGTAISHKAESSRNGN